MKIFLIIFFFLCSLGSYAQNDTCGTTNQFPNPPFCVNFAYTDSATVCWEFTATFSPVSFNFDAIVNCASVSKEYILYDSACNVVQSNTNGLFSVTPGNYTICGVFTCSGGGPGIRGVCQLTPLPVEWLYAYAHPLQNYIEIKWATASEHNNDYFILEKANEHMQFSPITQVKGHGTINVLSEYKAVDTNPHPVNLYRLKQIDYNGDYKYSQVFACNFSLEDENTNCEYYTLAGQKIVKNSDRSLTPGFYIKKCDSDRKYIVKF